MFIGFYTQEYSEESTLFGKMGFELVYLLSCLPLLCVNFVREVW